MGRRSGVVGVINAIARDVARAQRQAEAARRRAIQDAARIQRQIERLDRQAAREAAAADREAKRQYLEDQAESARDQTEAIEQRLRELENVLRHTLQVDDAIDFGSLRVSEEYPPFVPPADLARSYEAPSLQVYRDAVPALGWLTSRISWFRARHEARLRAVEEDHRRDLEDFNRREGQRKATLEAARRSYDEARFAFVWKATQRNTEVAEFEKSYLIGAATAIVAYSEMVLTRSGYPDGFPQEFRLAYVPESRELVVDYELPGVAIVPSSSEVKYVKAKDAFEEKPRKPAEIKDRYQDLTAALALRTIHEVLEADRPKHIDTVTFSGFVNTVDRATGRDIRPYLISVRTTREEFQNIDLSRVDLRACLRNLGAQVSPRADEMIPVKPIIEFDMVDKRFVDQLDVLSELDSRENIMDLNPFEFENLVGNIFQKYGLETRQTRASRDGGVDVVAYDTRPVLGGKVVIQAKRYRNTVGVSAVRDLFGTMMNEGANKGILVTTSGYGSDAFEFAKDKPIELIDGPRLLYLCNEVGVAARIIMPAE